MINEQAPLFHFKKTRKQRSWLFINMAVMCWVYVAAIFGYEHVSGNVIPSDTKTIATLGLVVASLILLCVAMWHRKHPATFEATVTPSHLRILYPNSAQWSFEVALKDIKRFESRQTMSHAGSGIPQHGVLLNDGTFHHISMNYGVSLGDIHKAVQKVYPQVPFPTKVNQKVEGFLSKPYDN